MFCGGFGDIYQASYNGKTVALKHIRTFHRDADQRRIRLVGPFLCEYQLDMKNRAAILSGGARLAASATFLHTPVYWDRSSDFPIFPVHGFSLDGEWHCP
jgi:hypothetical protein